MFHSDGYDRYGYRCNQQFSTILKMKMFRKVLTPGHCRRTICCNCDQHIRTMKHMSNEWHSSETIFANTLLKTAQTLKMTQIRVKMLFLFLLKKTQNCIIEWGVCGWWCGTSGCVRYSNKCTWCIIILSQEYQE